MSLKIDVALLGTGLSPLLAANLLLSRGKSVIILNPDFDFFREESELPLDPLWPPVGRVLDPLRLARSNPDFVLEQLRPDFPGAVELYPSADSQADGFRDTEAPHVRARTRLWVRSERHFTDSTLAGDWEAVEELFVGASDADLHPQELEGIMAAKRFPGSNRKEAEGLRGIQIPRLCDVDVSRYRNGLLEYVRERLGEDRVISGIGEVELNDKGIRFYSGKGFHHVELKDGLMAFWTPRLTHWIQGKQKRIRKTLPQPLGIRVWEEWSLVSRDALDPEFAGVLEDMVVWADFEGAPQDDPLKLTNLSVLKAGPRIAFEDLDSQKIRMSWASTESFSQLSQLCHNFLKWEKFSVRSMRPRLIFEWDDNSGFCEFSHGNLKSGIVLNSDGPIVDVTSNTRKAVERFL